jgi:aspartate/glutamate racemase
MSFAEITKDYVAKSVPVVITHNGTDYKFYAKQMSYIESVEITVKKQNGQNWFTDLIVASIVDDAGKRMTLEQAEKLSQEHADAFITAAIEANKGETQEKK